MNTKKGQTIKIGRHTFTGFHGGDWQNLVNLNYTERVIWLKFRFKKVCLRPLNTLLRAEKDAFIWLAVFDFTCSAVSGLASFEFGTWQNGEKTSRDGDEFRSFVRAHFKKLTARGLQFDRPKGNHHDDPVSVLWKYFRCGISHGLAVRWGSIDYNAHYIDRSGPGDRKFMVIDPKQYVKDFKAACDDFFEKAATWGGTPKEHIFQTHFKNAFLLKGDPSQTATIPS